MEVYVLFFRGINVSGQKKVEMIKLRELFEKIGFLNVSTYIQSGNVVFESDLKKDEIKRLVQDNMLDIFDLSCEIVIKTYDELVAVSSSNPYVAFQGNMVYTTFFESNISIFDINEYCIFDEKVTFSKDVVYLYCPNGYGKTKLTNVFFERKLDINATTRNQNTILKLLEMCEKLKC